MRITLFPKMTVVLALGALFSHPVAGSEETRKRTRVATTPHFAFYSDFATNLNDALIAAGLARKRGHPELFHSVAEKPCFDGLPPASRAAWDRAVDYYADIISPGDWNGREQYLIRMHLAGFDAELKGADGRELVAIVASFRSAATPAYNACRWAAQDEANRRWIEGLKPQLASHEQAIARRLEVLYGKPWDGLPIPVDVVETVNWSGANSIFLDPAGGHLMISNSSQGPVALETVFHEASHLFMRPGDPLPRALEGAAKAIDRPLPRDLWHVVMFYTTGEAVRRILDDVQQPEYTPMIYEIYGRSDWGRYQGAIDATWPAYMDGRRTLGEAASDLMRALGDPATTR